MLDDRPYFSLPSLKSGWDEALMDSEKRNAETFLTEVLLLNNLAYSGVKLINCGLSCAQPHGGSEGQAV